ncbi:vesicle-associated protein 1-3-like [Typha angustifolia]|uniref:vesicle-associated protein 1-3-like n=1 Tax=Typha angustifolia TaxID=59011 RepID=UPI003C2ACA13
MSSNTLLKVQPWELKIPLKLGKQSSCCMQLTNKTDQNVAFKVKTTTPKKYFVSPKKGIVLPGSTCSVTVTMQAQKRIPSDYNCKDKFLIQSVVVNNDVSKEDINPEMFDKESGKVVEFKLRVVHVTVNPPSPVPEEEEEEDISKSSVFLEEKAQCSSLFDDALPMILKLAEENNCAVEKNLKLRRELDLLIEERARHRKGFSFMLVVIIAILSILFGCFIKTR